MAPIEKWGPATWTLFHTLAEHLKEESYREVAWPLFEQIKRTCGILPCPDCTQHAVAFTASVRPHQIATKHDFKSMLYVFHNMVNRRKRKALFPFAQLSVEYSREAKPSLRTVFNLFAASFTTRGDMMTIADEMHRKRVIEGFHQFISSNIHHFN